MTKNISQEIEKYKEQRDMNMLLESRWISTFLQLLSFKDKNGHTDIPAKYKQNKSLGYWVRRQRLIFHEKKIDPLREQLLKLAGFNFRLLEFHNWDTMYQKLMDFKKQFNHIRITESYEDTQLYNWLVYQRKLYWRGKLEFSKVEKLNNLGIDMKNKTINSWNDKYSRLVDFKKENGHLYVCQSFSSDKQLINFVKVVRRNKDKILEQRRKKLDKLGFIWNPGKELTILLNKKRGEEMWMRRYEELKIYKKQFKTCHILTTSKTHYSLANWISVQRNKVDRLSQKKIALLNEIDFFFENYPKKHKKK